MKILIIEDEPEMIDNLVSSLVKENYLVEVANNFEEAMIKVGVYDYDCILLDITLPDGNGLEILKKLKQDGKEDGVIIISAKNSIDDKIEGLDLGADDYLPKPFHMSELHARVKSVLRRRKFNGKNEYTLGNVLFDLDARSVYINKEKLELNRKEYDVLVHLATNNTRLVSKYALAEHVWGDNIDETDSFEFIYSQIKNLRKKLKDANSTLKIKAVYGIGYKCEVI